MRLVVTIPPLIALFLFPALTHAEVFRWVDKDGQVYFGSVPPRVQEPYKAGDNKELLEQGKQSKNIRKLSKENNVKEGNGKINSETESNINTTDTLKNKNTGSAEEITPQKEESVLQGKMKPLKDGQDLDRSAKLDELIKRIKEDLNIKSQKELASQADQNQDTESQKYKKGQNAETVVIENEKMAIIKPDSEITSKESKNDEGAASADVDTGANTVEKDTSGVSKETESTGYGDKEMEIEEESTSELVVVDDNMEKCGFFMGYVEQYNEKIRFECPDTHCDLLYRQLEKYQNKMEQYCGKKKAN